MKDEAISADAAVADQYQNHPISEYFLDVQPDKLRELTDKIMEQGLLDDIVLFEGRVLDGRARQKACIEAGIVPRYKTFEGTEQAALAFVVCNNMPRQPPTDDQRRMMAAMLVQTKVGSNQHSDREDSSVGTASKLLGVSESSVKRYRKLLQKAPRVAKAVAAGRFHIKTATVIAKLPESDQNAIFALDKSPQVLGSEAARRLKLHLKSQPVTMPDGKFGVILADPPWLIRPEPSYATMTLEEIKADMAAAIAAKAAEDCFIFVWATEATRAVATQMLQCMGLKVKELFVWMKDKGRGHPGRPYQNAEFLILAEKGSPTFVDTVGLKTCFTGDSDKHSEKPAEPYEMIVNATNGPRLEMYARKPHDGFEAHGNQIEDANTDWLAGVLYINPSMPVVYEVKHVLNSGDSIERITSQLVAADKRFAGHQWHRPYTTKNIFVFSPRLSDGAAK